MSDSYFPISVKGLYLNEEGKLLLLKQQDGMWETPGGQVEQGEQLLETLRRECKEETGLECTVLDDRPYIAYTAIDSKNNPRLMIFYVIKFDSLDFTPSDECIDMQFYTNEEIRDLPMASQMKPLIPFLDRR